MPRKEHQKKIRYAVVGLGYIAQSAVLPAFKHAKNSQLTALVSGDPVKLKKLGQQYGVTHLYSYDEYEECLKSGHIDAVYIAMPNSLHCEFAVKAARARINILCEKPMAMNMDECITMMAQAEAVKMKLMIAYRLHFEKANLKALEIARSGKLGDLRLFNASFSMQIKDENSRLQKRLGGGPLFDIGIYCINAVRNIYQAEPLEVFAFNSKKADGRFDEVDEMVNAVMYFPDERLASFTCSFGAADTSSYEIVGTKGSLRMDPAFEMVDTLQYTLNCNGREKKQTFSKRDQFAPELIYFSKCILEDTHPEPDGIEGLADVRVINALNDSLLYGKPISLKSFNKKKVPDMKHEKRCAPVEKKPLIHAQTPSH